MVWNLDFISEEDFKKHVRATIMKYGEKLESQCMIKSYIVKFNINLEIEAILMISRDYEEKSVNMIFYDKNGRQA